jgi:hypothetical protein
MKKLIFLAAAAGLGLVSASPPPTTAAGAGAPAAYPPCSRTVTDHCIQLYERGVRAPRAAAQPAARSDDELTSVMAAADDPQGPHMAAGQNMPAAAGAPRRRVLAQRVRRAGERG